jgi:hypothetical protein
LQWGVLTFLLRKLWTTNSPRRREFIYNRELEQIHFLDHYLDRRSKNVAAEMEKENHRLRLDLHPIG